MAKIQMIVQLEYDEKSMHGDDSESIEWFLKDVLMGESGEKLHLFSSLIGDIIGEIKVLDIGVAFDLVTGQQFSDEIQIGE